MTLLGAVRDKRAHFDCSAGRKTDGVDISEDLISLLVLDSEETSHVIICMTPELVAGIFLHNHND